MNDDLISRQTVLKIIDGWHDNNRDVENIEDLIVLITYMDPVNLQEPKTGHWIRVTDEAGHIVWECDKCGWQQRYNTNFCPDCGCRMVEPQESEDKE